MKKFIFIVLCVFVPMLLIASAQIKKEEGEVKEPATKLESFLAKKGQLIVKDFYNLGAVGGSDASAISFTALVIYEPGQENQRIMGLRIKVSEAGDALSDTSFLDLEEITSLTKAIAYMLDLSEKWKGVNKEYSTEVIFSTKDGFQIGFIQGGTKQTAFFRSGDMKTTCLLTSMQDLNSVKAKADEGLKLLSEK